MTCTAYTHSNNHSHDLFTRVHYYKNRNHYQQKNNVVVTLSFSGQKKFVDNTSLARILITDFVEPRGIVIVEMSGVFGWFPL